MDTHPEFAPFRQMFRDYRALQADASAPVPSPPAPAQLSLAARSRQLQQQTQEFVQLASLAPETQGQAGKALQAAVKQAERALEREDSATSQAAHTQLLVDVSVAKQELERARG